MKNHFSKYDELIPEDVMKEARSFRASYVGKYIKRKSNSYYRLFEIAPCVDLDGKYRSNPIPFVSCLGREKSVYAQLEADGYKVHLDYSDTYGGKQLLYRDIKDLPYH